MTVNLLDFDGESLTAWFAEQGEKPFRAKQVLRWIHRSGVADFDAMTDIAKNRELMGATNPKEAAPGTIRADFAESIDANAVHGSDAPETAAVEVAFFFPGLNVYAGR